MLNAGVNICINLNLRLNARKHKEQAAVKRDLPTGLTAVYVRFGSKSDIGARPPDVRFTPKSRH
jgi:hypothetical protein